jgi:hypothetical protein
MLTGREIKKRIKRQKVRRFHTVENITELLRNSVDALKPIHHFVIILSHPVEIILSPVDRLLSSSFRTTKSDTFLHSELHQLFKKKQKNRK